MNDLHNTLMNNAWIAMQKIFVKKKTLQGDNLDRPKVFPGAMWEEEQTGDIRALDVGDVKSIGMQLENILLSFAERISNITNWNLGTQKGKGGQSTATEFMGVLQEGNIGREPFLQRCYKILTKLCEWTIDYNRGRMPPGMPRQLPDGNGGSMLPSAQNMNMYQQKGISPTWQEEDIMGDFSWVWQGTSLNSDRQWNLMVDKDLLDLSQHPMIGQNLLAVWTILKKNLVDRNIKNWEEILPPREAVLKEMQMKQERIQAEQQAGQGNQNVANLAVKKLVDKGMPANQAMQAVRERIGQGAGNIQ